jgi:ATP-dependent Lhr-like helicase
MHRIEQAVERKIPRIGLSATLGDMNLAAEYLRSGEGSFVAIVESRSSNSELKILVKGYEEPLIVRSGDDNDEEQEPTTPSLIAIHLFKSLRGSNNLVFPNSRREVERFTHLLNNLCFQHQVPNEFWPHHGSLSKEIRTETEAALKQKYLPATAICTNTLELGIDIGAVKSVAQIDSPPSVASLRQRLGRSGRRKGEPAILRCYCIEDALGAQISLATELRLELIETTAMISLLLEGWFEPPATNGIHLSTLVQQMLSVIAQYGGATIGQLYTLLCGEKAPFSGLSKEEFMTLVRHLGHNELLMQDSSGVLLHGRVGEKLVNHYTFYAAFVIDEEFRIVASGRTLGTIPISQMLTVGQRILFAGKTWFVEQIDEAQKTVYVIRTSGGVPPLFSGSTGRIHTRVRQCMKSLLESNDVPLFLDEVARRFLVEARQGYADRNLGRTFFIDQGKVLYILTWLGDAANEAIACLLISRGFIATAAGPGVEVQKGLHTTEEILDALIDTAIEDPPALNVLLADVKNLQREKWDWALPDDLLRIAYASLYLNLDEALRWTKKITSMGSS